MRGLPRNPAGGGRGGAGGGGGGGESVEEVLQCDLKLEMRAHPDLKAGIADCERLGDYVSRDLLQSILESEEEHIDFLETQLELVARVGLQNYCQSQIEAPASPPPPPRPPPLPPLATTPPPPLLPARQSADGEPLARPVKPRCLPWGTSAGSQSPPPSFTRT